MASTKAVVDVFSGTLLLFDYSMDAGNLIYDSSGFSKSRLNIWVHVPLKRGLENFEHYFASV